MRRKNDEDVPPTLGQRAAEKIADIVGSWAFIIAQVMLICVWIFFNIDGIVGFDEYPFILLNLFLSVQAAFTGPMILIAQNRQNEKDRKILYGDFEQDLDTHERLRRVENKLGALLAGKRRRSQSRRKRR